MKPVKIEVCAGCGICDKSVRKTLKKLRREYGDQIRIKKKDCLDLCDYSPSIRVDGKAVAPAKPKMLKKRVAKRLAQRA